MRLTVDPRIHNDNAPLGKLELCNRLLDTGIVKERLLDCDELLAVTVGMYVSP